MSLLILAAVTPLALLMPALITRGRIAAAKQDPARVSSTLRGLTVRAAIVTTLVIYLLMQRNTGSAIIAGWLAIHLGQVVVGILQLKRVEKR